jgi:hemoglobin
MRSSIPHRLLGSLFLPAGLFLTVVSVDAQGVEAAERSLYERLGGLEAITVVVDDFMNVFARDAVMMANPAVRERKTLERLPYLTYQISTLVCEVTGGPCQYTGASLAAAHDGLDVSNSEWERMGTLFAQTLDRHAVPASEQEELMAILGGTKPEIVVSSPGTP